LLTFDIFQKEENFALCLDYNLVRSYPLDVQRRLGYDVTLSNLGWVDHTSPLESVLKQKGADKRSIPGYNPVERVAEERATHNPALRSLCKYATLQRRSKVTAEQQELEMGGHWYFSEWSLRRRKQPHSCGSVYQYTTIMRRESWEFQFWDRSGYAFFLQLGIR